MGKSVSNAKASSSPSRPDGKRKVPALLSQEEWDFESLGDDDDVPTCWLWEYWREACRRNPEVRAALTSVQQEVRANDTEILAHDQQELLLYSVIAQKFEDLPSDYPRMLAQYGKFILYLWSAVNPLASDMDGLANISPEYFPKRPFLSLDSDLRKICRAHVNVKNPIETAPLKEISQPTKISGEHQPSHNSVHPLPKDSSVASFSIDWQYANHFIEEAFRIWLVQNRGARQATVFWGLGRGKSEFKSMRRDLKALAALRLMEHYGSLVVAVAALKKAGKTLLYSNKSDWSKSKHHALSLLSGFGLTS